MINQLKSTNIKVVEYKQFLTADYIVNDLYYLYLIHYLI